MGIPKDGWFIIYKWKTYSNGWFRGTPILGNLQIIEWCKIYLEVLFRIARGQDLTRSHKCVPLAGKQARRLQMEVFRGCAEGWRFPSKLRLPRSRTQSTQVFWTNKNCTENCIWMTASSGRTDAYTYWFHNIFWSLPIDSIDDTIQYYTLSIKKVLYTYMVYTCCICIPTHMATPPALTGLNVQGVHLPESCLQALDRRLAAMELHGT